MISATVCAPSDPLELALHHSRTILRASRTESAKLLIRARKRASTYRDAAMERGYRIGLAHAEADSSRRCSETIEALHALYSDTVDKAHRDVYVVAQRIVEELIEERLRENPDLLMQWIARAIALVKSDIELTLRYHPRHHESLKDVTTHIPRATRTYADPSLGNADFVLDTNIGAITFSWKALLATIKPVESRESNP